MYNFLLLLLIISGDMNDDNSANPVTSCPTIQRTSRPPPVLYFLS